MNNYCFMACDVVDIISPKSKWNGKVEIIYKCYESGLFGVCLIGRRKHHMQDDPPKNMRHCTSQGLRIRLPSSGGIRLPSSGGIMIKDGPHIMHGKHTICAVWNNM
jgi:hypothetical protein